MHDRDQMEAEGIAKDQLTREVEAESVAYVVCNHFGLDTSEYSFSYIASWSSGKNMKELRASMDTIRKTSADMIGQIEEKLKELHIERPEQEVTAVEQTEELSVMQYAEQTINRLEQERTIFSNDQRNLIVNFAYKLDDREATEKLAENLAESILDGNREAVLKLIGEAEEQIDSLPDSMIGLSELHEAGFYSESMLPLTRERAVELHHEGVTVYGLTGAVGGQEQSQRIMNNGFDDAVKQKILDSLHPPVQEQTENSKPKLDNWQKYLENGEYLRSAEITEEANYNMIDGLRNNSAPKNKKKRPKESVLAKLNEKKEEVAKRSGQKAMQQIMGQDVERTKK